MSIPTVRALRLGVTATLLTGVASLGATSPAEAFACSTRSIISSQPGAVSAARSLLCDPPGTVNPLPTTLQRKQGTSWVDVTPTGDGAAFYTCAGTTLRTYRIKEATWAQVTANCS